MQMAANSSNAIVFTTRASIGPDSLAAQLLPSSSAATSLPQSVTVSQTTVVPLAGAELAAWRAARADEAARNARAAAAVRERAREAEELAAATAAAAEAERAREAEAAAAAVAAAAAAAAAVAATKSPMDVDAAAPVYLEDESEVIALIGDVDDCGGAVAVRRALRGGLAARFPMFARDLAALTGALAPTDYGLQVDPANFVDEVPASALGTAAAVGVGFGSGVSSAGGGSSSGLALPLSAAAAATKTVRSVLTVRLAARVLLHALEGVATGESLINVLESIAPQRLVVLAGSTGVGSDAALASARALANAAVTARVAAADAVHVLSPSDTVSALDVSSRVAEVTLRVLDAAAAAAVGAPHSLALEPVLRRVGDHHRAASVMTQVVMLPNGDVVLTAANDAEHGDGAGGGHAPVMLRAGGALRIPDLRKRLRGAGVASEVIDGEIVTRAGVLIKRRTGGGVDVEGPPVAELFAVREIVAAAYMAV